LFVVLARAGRIIGNVLARRHQTRQLPRSQLADGGPFVAQVGNEYLVGLRLRQVVVAEAVQQLQGNRRVRLRELLLLQQVAVQRAVLSRGPADPGPQRLDSRLAHVGLLVGQGVHRRSQVVHGRAAVDGRAPQNTRLDGVLLAVGGRS
jgi:hypothetical protein